MARRALGSAALALTRALDAVAPGPWVVACSGGADSLALAWAAAFVARRRGTPCRAVVVDHG
nr:tRNA lysidine(34) synthetase TilS [Propionibacterium sp.]